MRVCHRDRPLLTALLLLAIGFTLAACGGEGPQDTAARFWEAAQNRDVAAVEALSIPSESSRFNFDDSDTEIDDLTIGELSVDGGRAEVETSLVLLGDDMNLEVEFSTVLVRQDGEWLVDMDETTDEIMKTIMGASVREIGEALGEGMKDAMEGMAEGFAEGMENMAKAFEDAAENIRTDGSRNR